MKKHDEKRVVAARAIVGDPPKGCTLAEWIVWRKLEDARMECSMEEQRTAYFEKLAGATIHWHMISGGASYPGARTNPRR